MIDFKRKKMAKVIITAAITGAVNTPTMSPYLPITPEQIIDEILAVHQAGGAVCHVHVRDPKTGHPEADLGMFREIASIVKTKCDIILCLTTGGGMGMTTEERVQPIIALKPELGSLNAGSLNYGFFPVIEKFRDWKYEWEPKFLAMTEDFVFKNSFKDLREYSEFFNKFETKPELEVYDAGMINNIAYLISRGYLRKPVYIQFVMGVLGGITPSPQNLIFMIDYAKRSIGDFQFSVCAAGRSQFEMCTQSLLLGGHARVGLEDNLFLDKGIMAKSNAEQVAKIIRIAKELGIEPATPADARKILGLKGLDKVNY